MKTIFVNKIDGVISNYEQVVSQLDGAFATVKNGRYSLVLQRHREKRSLSANNLLWLWLTCIERETDTPKQDIHDYYCGLFLSRPTVINGIDVVVTGGTSRLDTAQFAEFLNKVQADAAAEFGITLPQPEDRFFEEFYQEYIDNIQWHNENITLKTALQQ